MEEFIASLDINQYLPAALAWATDILLALLILITGLWIAGKVISEVLSAHPHILNDPAPFIEVATLNDSSVDFIVRPFCYGEHYFEVLYSIPEQIKKALDKANIEIPFPHRKVIVVNENS